MLTSTPPSINDAPVTPLTESPNLMALLPARLRASGLRITQPRLAILAALIKMEEPASVEAIHASLTRFHCDLVTVYRTLSTLEEIGLVRRCFFLNGTCLYRPTFLGKPIYHVVCRDDNSVSELDPEMNTDLSAAIAQVEQVLRKRGYTEVSHMLEFFARRIAKAPIGVKAEGLRDVPMTGHA